MSVAAEALHQRIHRALLRRRAPAWLAAALPWLGLLSLPGLALWALWVAFDLMRLRRKTTQHGLRWLDAAVPALEDSSALLLKAATPIARLQQRRLLGRLLGRIDTALDAPTLQRIARQQARNGWPMVVFSVAAAALVWAWPQGSASHGVQPGATPPAAAMAALSVHVTPPAYTGLAAFESAPLELQVPEHSRVRWCLQGAASAPAAEPIELSDGTRLPLGSDCATWTASESMFWRWRGVRYTLRVVADLAPTITVRAPSELIQTLGPTQTSARIAISVRDDYLIANASLHLTLARGSGENVRFSDREMPLPRGADPRARDWEKTWTLAELGIEPGDDLYFFVRASDNAPGRVHISTSPTYTLRLPGPQAASEQAQALPLLVKPENLRSQRQVIIDTEQLLADVKANPRLAAAQVRARSEDIAADQAQLRRRYGQFLGEESSLFGDGHGADEHAGEQGTDGSTQAMQDLLARFGHSHDQAENATLFDEGTKKILRRALAAMWDAEKALRAITPQPALPFEYRALEAIKQLQQADRIYLHRTAFVPPPLKEDKRLTGDVLGARSYGRVQGSMAEGVPAPLLELMQALAGDGPLPALWSTSARAWIRQRLDAEGDRLAAQRAVQDVLDGCAICRPALSAWLRSGVAETPVRLQAGASGNTAFTQAWRQAGGR